MLLFVFSSRRRHTRWNCDWSSDVCSSDLTSPEATGRGQAGDVPLLGAHTHLWENLEERQVHRDAQDHPQAAHCQVESGKSRFTEAHASAAGGGREMVAKRGRTILQLSCCTRESPEPAELSARGT